MRSFAIILCLLSLYLIEVECAPPEATFKCIKTAAAADLSTPEKKEFDITITMDAVNNKAYALTSVTKCSTGATAVDGLPVTDNVFKITTSDSTTFTALIDVAKYKTACGITDDTTDAEKKTLQIVVQKDPLVLKKTDLLFTFVCDFANPNTVAVVADVSTIQGQATQGTVKTGVLVDLKVYDDTPAIKTGGIDLGAMITLRSQLTTTGTVKGCRMVSCEAGLEPTFAAKLTMYKDDGCGDATNSESIVADTAKFEADSTLTANDKIGYKSAPFAAFTFPGSQSVYFRCNCKGCTTAGDAACDDTKLTCQAGTGRKKRAVTNHTTPDTTVRTIAWIISKVPESSTADKQAIYEKTVANCLNHISFISIVSVLVILLIVSMGISVFFCAKLTRSNRSTTKEVYPNPAYKA